MKKLDFLKEDKCIKIEIITLGIVGAIVFIILFINIMTVFTNLINYIR